MSSSQQRDEIGNIPLSTLERQDVLQRGGGDLIQRLGGEKSLTSGVDSGRGFGSAMRAIEELTVVGLGVEQRYSHRSNLNQVVD